MKNNPSTTGLRIALHNNSTLLGAYFFSWALTAFGIVTLVALGVDFQEAEMAMSLLAFLVFLPLFLWAFAYDRPGVGDDASWGGVDGGHGVDLAADVARWGG